jgi:hypothetical protein
MMHLHKFSKGREVFGKKDRKNLKKYLQFALMESWKKFGKILSNKEIILL